jgi:hypothetical protein
MKNSDVSFVSEFDVIKPINQNRLSPHFTREIITGRRGDKLAVHYVINDVLGGVHLSLQLKKKMKIK